MRILRSLTLPKEPDYPEANDDYFFWTAQGQACAMSDGASESFDSRTWARLLCQVFTQTYSQNPAPSINEASIRSLLAQSRKMFLATMAQRKLSWSQQAAFDRGNFASILGIVEHAQEVHILAIGDTVALWRDLSGKLHSHILQTPEEFKKNPVLLSSDARGDTVLFERERHRWAVRCLPKAEIRGKKIFLMTDALGCYAIEAGLKQGWEDFEATFKLPDHEFKYWVSQERLQGRLRKDDTTLAVVELA